MGLRQQGSQAVAPVFESLSCLIFFMISNRDTPSLHPSIHKIFRCQEISETQKGSPTKFFATVRQQTFNGMFWDSLPPTLLNYENFGYQKLCQTEKDPPRSFSVEWDKKISDGVSK